VDDSGSMTCKDDGKKSRWDYAMEALANFVN